MNAPSRLNGTAGQGGWAPFRWPAIRPKGFALGLSGAAMLLSLIGIEPCAAQAVATQDAGLGCRVILCLPGPNGPSGVSNCDETLTRLWSQLGAGRPFPQCPGTGVTASAIGYAPYKDCYAGQLIKSSEGVAVCHDSAASPATWETLALARDAPYYVDVAFPDGWRVRLWFSQAER